MNEQSQQPDSLASRLDDAISRRLGKLGALPLDCASLADKLERSLVHPEATTSRRWVLPWWRPLSSMAAALAIVGLIGWIVSQGGTPAVAAPLELSKLHQALVRGQVPVMAAASIAEANRHIALRQADAPRLPGLSGATIKSCCMSNVQGVLVTAVLMQYEGQPVTLVVAAGKDFASPVGQIIQRGGRKLSGHQSGDLEMVMAHHQSTWLCVMGNLPQQKLADLAARIEF